MLQHAVTHCLDILERASLVCRGCAAAVRFNNLNAEDVLLDDSSRFCRRMVQGHFGAAMFQDAFAAG